MHPPTHSYDIGYNPSKFEQIYVVRRCTKGVDGDEPVRLSATPIRVSRHPPTHRPPSSSLTPPPPPPQNNKTGPIGWIFRAYPGPYKAYLDLPDGKCELVKVYDKGEVPKLRDVSKLIREESQVGVGVGVGGGAGGWGLEACMCVCWESIECIGIDRVSLYHY
jgi:hypothetical protein